MRYASVTNRLQGLGSDKWRNHLRAKQMLHDGLPIIMLSIGEPDIAPLLAATIAFAYCIASRNTNPNPSPALGITKTSHS